MKQALIDNLMSVCTVLGIDIQLRSGINEWGSTYFSIINLHDIIKDEEGVEMTVFEWFKTNMADKVYNWVVTLPSSQVISYTLSVTEKDKTGYDSKKTGRFERHKMTSVKFQQDSGSISSSQSDLEQSLMSHLAKAEDTAKIATA
tara:strand:- start:42 stop:476 length:435 start_codon:yes stop_codon:yes gene_type:complete